MIQDKFGQFRRRFSRMPKFITQSRLIRVWKCWAYCEIWVRYFDIASIYELDKVLSLGVSPDRISFGNTIKKARHIGAAYDKGVRLFTSDCEADIRNLAQRLPVHGCSSAF